MDSKDANMGDSAVDWNDPMFANTQFEDAMPAESPYGANSTFDNFTAYSDFIESPGGLMMRTTSKPPHDFAPTPSQHMQLMASRSNESSSQDSASDTSSRRKRKTTSESPASDAPEADKSRLVMKGDTLVDLAEKRSNRQSRSKHNSQRLSQTMSGRNSLFDFNSAATSPINPGAFDAALSLDEQVHGIMMPQAQQNFAQASPLQTINPATFGLEGSRDQSPTTNNIMFNSNRSPRGLFTSPTTSDVHDAFTTQAWTPTVATNPAWPTDFSAAPFTSPGALQFTPSPTSASVTVAATRPPPASPGRSRLNIAPISTKSRVETQISIIMTLETPPPHISYLHLPLQTIAKSKLLAKEDVDPHRVLELHTMLVCTSAMRNPQHKAKALRRAAAQNNLEIQRRAEAQRGSGDEEKNDPKNVPDDEKPSNGGEVRICNNCIQRERKRAARKKLKKEEEQQHWERYETERVVVFNSNELLPFKPWEAPQLPPREPSQSQEDYQPPDGAIQVSAAMRIACYCRHQNEKEGFQVIFTLKDADGKVVAQEMSDSILITDDHKTHLPNFAGQVQDQVMFGTATPVYNAHGLPTSYSMVDMSQHAQQGFTSSRSTGNLQALAYNQQFGNQGHLHQMQTAGFTAGTTPATMTPTGSLSRPGSPTSAGNSGPNKKRKSSSFHRKVPSGLAMTPRVDTGVGSASTAPSSMAMISPFTPATTANGAGFINQDQAFMNMAGANGNASYLQTDPTTPNENLQYVSQQLSQGNHARNPQQVPDYYQSLPGSRVTSRAPSPVMQSNRPNLAAMARQQVSRDSTQRNQLFTQNMQQPTASDTDSTVIPMIHKITPTEGPVTGGTEVSIYGRDFAQGMQVYFGDQAATAVTFYGDQALLCTSPPGRVGGVQVTVLPVGHLPQYNPSQMNKPVFTYKNANEKVMEMALRFMSQQQTGNSGAWWQVTQQNASRWMQQNMNRPGYQSGYDGNMFSVDASMTEKMLLSLLQQFDVEDMPDPALLDDLYISGQTALTMASAAGLQDVVKALLSRGANPDARDANGCTPLMHAALHSQVQVFRMLIAKGADPAIRSLVGLTALEVAPSELRNALQQVLWSTPRTRNSRPLLHTKSSATSISSSGLSWDISSASMYESESWSSKPSPAPSRRLSAVNVCQNALDQENSTDTDDKQDTVTVKNHYAPIPAAMFALRDTLALQIQHFHQTLHKSVLSLHFAIRPLELEEDQDSNAMLRKLSTLIHNLHEAFPYLPKSSLDAVLPPSYSDLYPEKVRVASDGIDWTPISYSRAKAEKKAIKKRHAKQQLALDQDVDMHARGLIHKRQAWIMLQLFVWLFIPLLVMLTAVILHAVGALSLLASTPRQLLVDSVEHPAIAY